MDDSASYVVQNINNQFIVIHSLKSLYQIGEIVPCTMLNVFELPATFHITEIQQCHTFQQVLQSAFPYSEIMLDNTVEEKQNSYFEINEVNIVEQQH